MNWSEKIRRACGEEMAREGEQLLKGVAHERMERTEDGSVRVSAKVIDPFQFVSHASATVTDNALTGFSCDCPFGGRQHRLCRHVAALLLRFDETFSAVFAPEPQPEPTENEPVQEPTPVEEPASVEETPVYGETGEKEEAPLAEEPFLPEMEAPGNEAAPTEGEDAPWEADEEAAALPPRSMEILFGHRLEDGEPVIWRPNDTEQVFHTNMGIIGTMGTGKTQFTKSLIAQLYRQQGNNYDGQPLGMLIFDYKGDYNQSQTDFCKAVPARVLKPYLLPYNPLALNRTRKFKPLLPLHTASVFKDTVSKIYGLGPKQQQTLLNCLIKAYQEQGIDPENEATWDRKAPTFAQACKIFDRETEGRTPDSLTSAMRRINDFRIFERDPAKARSLADVLQGGIVVVDLSGYDEDFQSLVVAITLDLFYAQMQACGSSKTDGRYRQLRSLILVDEADNFMSQDFPSLRKIMKEGREFGVGVILSTQSLSRFVGGQR
ncbi:MAG: DUF87 domain-containing protein [Clostridiales bacterium]|nr:DUF87 domain-containing protein [Clostridiales bacterium]